MSTELQEILAFVESVVLKDVESGRALRAIVGYLAQLEASAAQAQAQAPAPAPTSTTKSSKEVTN